MALKLRWMFTVAGLIGSVAQTASAPPALAQETTELPLSTRLLMAFHNPAVALWDLPALPMSARLLMAFRAQTGAWPDSLAGPSGAIMRYGPGPAFVPPVGPALEPVPVTTVILRPDAALARVQVNAGAVVTWVNETLQPQTLVIDSDPEVGGSGWTSRHTATALPNSSLSLAFHQPGTYEYYLYDEPTRRARLVVTP